jgi:hypothetical protein
MIKSSIVTVEGVCIKRDMCCSRFYGEFIFFKTLSKTSNAMFWDRIHKIGFSISITRIVLVAKYLAVSRRRSEALFVGRVRLEFHIDLS